MVGIKQISTFSEFIQYISKNCDGKSIVYRGQPIDKSLIPKIARIRLHRGFVENEVKMFNDFKRRAVPFLPPERRTDLELLAIAQHHGMATRLLDWSENPFVALWFAVESPPRMSNDGSFENGVLWILDTQDMEFIDDTAGINPFDLNETRLYRPRHIASRIISQSGLFTLHHIGARSKKHVPLNMHTRYKRNLNKLIIPFGEFRKFRKELDRFGFNAQRIFPDIEGLCRDIQWQHSYLDDEGEARLTPVNKRFPTVY